MYGPCFSSIVGGHPLRSPTRHSLGRPLPYQLADGTQVPPKAHYCFGHRFLNPMTACGISSPFGLLSHTSGQVTNALRTRSPLRSSVLLQNSSFDLHVLSTPPAFILSQDQTLRKKSPLARCIVLYGRTTGLLPITFQLLRSGFSRPCFDRKIAI